MSKLKLTPEELEAEQISRRGATTANQRKILAYVRRVGQTSQNDIRVHVGSVAGLNELISANILAQDKQNFRITLPRH